MNQPKASARVMIVARLLFAEYSAVLYWWGFLLFCTTIGALFGFLTSPAGWLGTVFGLLAGYVVGTIPPVGPYVPYSWEDL